MKVTQEITSPAQLTALINSILKECLEDIAEKVLARLIVTVNKDWYQANDAQSYEATYQLLNSIVKTNIEPSMGGFSVSVFFDPYLLYPNKMDEGFNQHMGFDGRDFTSALIEVIEEGNPSPIYPHEGIFMLKNTSDWLEKNLMKIVRKKFNQYGMRILMRKK